MAQYKLYLCYFRQSLGKTNSCSTQKAWFHSNKNEKNELIPIRIVIGWRVSIDYMNLNTTTIKDHYPLPFMDQMLDRLASHPHYCFLDGYFRYNQIAIAPEN